jgi:DNA-binding transcriptional ArsR family regulator
VTEAEFDECLRAMSHHERRRYYLACLDKPRSAGELAELSDLALASVSEHLKVLRKSGLVEVKKDGRFWIYRANSERLLQVVTRLQAMLAG